MKELVSDRTKCSKNLKSHSYALFWKQYQVDGK